MHKRTKSPVADTEANAFKKLTTSDTKFLSPEDLPILLRDSKKRLIAGIKLEVQELVNNEFRLKGWCLGLPGLALLRDGKEVNAEIRRMPRNDVLQANSVTSDFDPGFELVVKNPEQGTYGLRWIPDANSKMKPVDFQLTIQIPANNGDSQSAVLAEAQISNVIPIQTEFEQKIKHYIECAVMIDTGIILVGWVDDRSMPVRSVYVQTKQSDPKEFSLKPDLQEVHCIRTIRPDVCRALGMSKSNRSQVGIVAWIPFDATGADEIIIAFDKQLRSKQSVMLTTLTGDTSVLERTFIHTGFALRLIAEKLKDKELLSWLNDKEDESFNKQTGKIAAIDHALVLFDKVLLLHGWIAAESEDISQVELIGGSSRIDIKDRLRKVHRSDLFSAFPWLKSRALGFVALIDEPDFLGLAQIKLRIRTRTTRNNLHAAPDVADWSILLSVMNANPSVIEPLAQLLAANTTMCNLPDFDERFGWLMRANFFARQKTLPSQVDNPTTTIVAIDRVFALGEGGMLLFGWHYEPEQLPQSITVHGPDGQFCDVTHSFFPLSRVDVLQNLKKRFPEVTDMCGFVCHVPMSTRAGESRAICFRFGERGDVWLKLATITEESNALQLVKNFLSTIPEKTLIYAGPALRLIAEKLKDKELLFWLDDKEDESFDKQTEKIAAIDHALVLFDKVLLLHGWIATESENISQVELIAGSSRIDIKDRLRKVHRSDLFSAFPWLKSRALGFVVLIDEPTFLDLAQIKLRIQTYTTRNILSTTPEVADWSVLLSVMNANPALVVPLTQLLSANTAMRSLLEFDGRFRWLIRANFLACQKTLPTHVDNPATTVVAIDRVFALGEGGMLLFGWRYEPELPPQSITVHDPDGQLCDVTTNFFPLARLDVSQNLKKRFPEVTDMCGFVCHVPMPTKTGELRTICFHFGERGDVWLKLLTATVEESNALQLIKNILGTIPAPDKIRGSLYDLFNQSLGRPIEFISASYRKKVNNILERQFGKPPVSPAMSVIVPLYGRYDFLRHQLAHFVDDPDFDNVDLIYVIDDPGILAPALDMAAAYHQLFCKPFRLVWYGQNLGFAGANNIGARVSRADTLLLLNSDVLPKASGWLSVLHKALNELPQAGAVGPLLQFADNSVQHAGMHPKNDPFFPGFLLNVHPGKGITWTKGDDPTQHPMLTAACLMLRKADYDAVGGLDEGYIIGDFEDSDLCLKLRKRGLTLWLVPAAKLWHLERQSQNLESIAGYRQLLTLFNGWRYHQKILKGEIANPEGSKI
ncbi:glycosyltransferase family 2 protein [Nitrosomonas sp. Nm33]|uniref:glycosyltransferase family 2 protein n=1 Tax=Nitrosomonas sp. Nm33 TaxID=133724 RepID=UPI00159FB57D|nr:glycosyltransferase family 2 protein [Nitrosomonas sp. Nm33]